MAATLRANGIELSRCSIEYLTETRGDRQRTTDSLRAISLPAPYQDDCILLTLRKVQTNYGGRWRTSQEWARIDDGVRTPWETIAHQMAGWNDRARADGATILPAKTLGREVGQI